MTKRIQATSKLVECPTCGVMVHARGLHGHMKLKHEIDLKTMTRVKPIDSGHGMLTRVRKGTDLSQLAKPRTPVKPFFEDFKDIEENIITQVKTKDDLSQIIMTQINPTSALGQTLTSKEDIAALSHDVLAYVAKDKAFSPGGYLDSRVETTWWNSKLRIREPKFVECILCGCLMELLVPVIQQDWFRSEGGKDVVCDHCIVTNYAYIFSGNPGRYTRYDKYGKNLII